MSFTESTPVASCRLWFLALAISLVFGCGSPSPAGAEAGVSSAVHARELLEKGRALPPRAEVLSLAQAVEAEAEREGAGARAHELHLLAARLHERVWRIEGREQDGKEAVDIFRLASRDAKGTGACDAAIEAAKIQGDLAHDASATYKELYRAERRFLQASGAATRSRPGDAGAEPDGFCRRAIQDAEATLAPFRPAAAILEAIELGLAGEGALALPSPPDAGGPEGLAKVVGIEQWPGKESARVVIVLSKPAHFRAGDEASAGGKAPRTFVEFDGVALGNVPRETAGGGIVSRVNAEATTTGARVSLELDGRAYRRVFHLLEPYRIVIDIARHPPGRALTNGRREVARVALDPGHGGNDPGAIGPSGLQEKDVTLAIAHRVAPILAAEGIQVLLTRDEDRFVTLEERTARANSAGADLFISIHCNAAENRARHGTETYVLDTTRDELAGRIAARENATSQAATNELGTILASMRLADQAKYSTRLADLLQRASLASIRTVYPQALDGGVHTAGFYVLVGARMPAVLFETNYISNPIEEQALGGEDYKQRLADGIANAVKAYREGR